MTSCLLCTLNAKMGEEAYNLSFDKNSGKPAQTLQEIFFSQSLGSPDNVSSILASSGNISTNMRFDGFSEKEESLGKEEGQKAVCSLFLLYSGSISNIQVLQPALNSAATMLLSCALPRVDPYHFTQLISTCTSGLSEIITSARMPSLSPRV